MNEAYAWREFTLEDGRGNRAWVFDALKNTQFKTDEIIALGEKWYEAKYFASSGAKEGYARIRRCSDDFLARLGFVREGRVYKIADKAGGRRRPRRRILSSRFRACLAVLSARYPAAPFLAEFRRYARGADGLGVQGFGRRLYRA